MNILVERRALYLDAKAEHNLTGANSVTSDAPRFWRVNGNDHEQHRTSSRSNNDGTTTLGCGSFSTSCSRRCRPPGSTTFPSTFEIHFTPPRRCSLPPDQPADDGELTISHTILGGNGLGPGWKEIQGKGGRGILSCTAVRVWLRLWWGAVGADCAFLRREVEAEQVHAGLA